MLAENSDSIYAAAALGAEAISGHYAAAVDKQVGDLRLAYSQQSTNYAALAKLYSDRAGTSGAPAVAPYVGGLSVAEHELDAEDTDLVQPTFRRRQFDYPGTNPSVSPRWTP